MAETVKLRALRTIQRVGSVVMKGDTFEASEAEANAYVRDRNPLAERVGAKAAKADDDAEPDAKPAAKKGKK